MLADRGTAADGRSIASPPLSLLLRFIQCLSHGMSTRGIREKIMEMFRPSGFHYSRLSATLDPGGTLDDPHIDGLKRRHGSSVRCRRYRSRTYTQSGQEVICSSCHRWRWKWSGAKMVGDACMRGHWTILLKSQHASKKIHKAMHAHTCGHDHEVSKAASVA